MVQLIHSNGQFTGLPHEDPQIHLRNFIEISDTYIPNGVSSDYVRLTLFPYSFLGAAKRWLDSEPPNSITTLDDLAKKFLSRFFPSKNTAWLRSEKLCFKQNQGEDMYQTWAHFKQMLNAWLHHMQTNEVLAHTFFEGLDYNACVLLNSAAGGQALAKTFEELFDLINRLSEGNPGYEREMPRTTTQKVVGILDVDQATTINAKLDAMQHNIAMHFKQMDLNHAPRNVVQQATNWYRVCGSGAHETEQCKANPDSINYVGNAQRGGGQHNYGNTYNPSLRSHLNFSWGGNQNQNQAQGTNQYRSQGAGQPYQNLNQGANPSAPKGGMTNEELLQKLMAEIGTKTNARIDK
ncbi:uncharacterized protein [Solanum tuberosum]|uniref:uncharacterized protein n=1 Tax=Solanum tuberosum TaxID=4113 RepID=UPI00073A4F98|nr:PREDICTED: uncharacterized protein LOC107060205 [Solanum tuberosum]